MKLICLLISQMHKLNPREVSGFPIGVKSRLESRDSESRLEARDPDYWCFCTNTQLRAENIDSDWFINLRLYPNGEGRTLRWLPRSPLPGLHALCNPLLLSMGGSVNVMGCHSHDYVILQGKLKGLCRYN